MTFKQNRVMTSYTSICGILILFFSLTISLLGCDLVQQLVPPDTPDSVTSVKIGFIYSPPDPGTTRNGAEIAVTLANEAGGIHGVPIELLIRDDKRDPVLGTQHAAELIDAGVLGNRGTGLQCDRCGSRGGCPTIRDTDGDNLSDEPKCDAKREFLLYGRLHRSVSGEA